MLILTRNTEESKELNISKDELVRKSNLLWAKNNMTIDIGFTWN